MGRHHEMVNQVGESSSGRLNSMLCDLDQSSRAAAVLMHMTLKLSVCDQLSMKLSMWDDVPLKLLSALGECVGRERSECQAQVRDCLDMVDSSKKDSLHRVAARFLLPGQPFRRELEAYCAGDSPIWRCAPSACKELIGYAFILLVEVRLEGEHSRIGSMGKRAQTGRLLPPAISAGLRRDDIDRLMASSDFRQFCEKHWNARFGPFVIKRLLSHALSSAELAMMSHSELLSRICMYDTPSQFQVVQPKEVSSFVGHAALEYLALTSTGFVVFMISTETFARVSGWRLSNKKNKKTKSEKKTNKKKSEDASALCPSPPD